MRQTVDQRTSLYTKNGFSVSSDDTTNPPIDVANGLCTVQVGTPNQQLVTVTFDSDGTIARINGVDVKNRLYAL